MAASNRAGAHLEHTHKANVTSEDELRSPCLGQGYALGANCSFERPVEGTVASERIALPETPIHPFLSSDVTSALWVRFKYAPASSYNLWVVLTIVLLNGYLYAALRWRFFLAWFIRAGLLLKGLPPVHALLYEFTKDYKRWHLEFRAFHFCTHDFYVFSVFAFFAVAVNCPSHMYPLWSKTQKELILFSLYNGGG